MENNPNQAREYDLVFSGQNPVSDGAVVLGGIERVKMRLASADVKVRIAALSEALKYEEAGLTLIIQALDKDSSPQVQSAAYWLLLARLQNKLPSFEFETVTVNKQGEIVQRKTKQARYFIEDLGNGVNLEMVYIPGGTFLMGSPKEERKYTEKPQHEVTVQPFFMSKFQVTQKQWEAVASLQKVERDLKPEPAYFKGNNRPVEQVSWYDTVEFCWRLSRRMGREYRLPSEAEWEYACRAGTTTPFHFGETITSELANYDGNCLYASEAKGTARGETTLVGSFPPNAFGLYICTAMFGSGAWIIGMITTTVRPLMPVLGLRVVIIIFLLSVAVHGLAFLPFVVLHPATPTLGSATKLALLSVFGSFAALIRLIISSFPSCSFLFFPPLAKLIFGFIPL